MDPVFSLRVFVFSVTCKHTDSFSQIALMSAILVCVHQGSDVRPESEDLPGASWFAIQQSHQRARAG